MTQHSNAKRRHANVTRLFENVRIVSWPTLALTIVAYSAAVLFLGPLARALAFIPIATNFLINGTLLCSLFVLAIVSIFIFGIGRCRPTDVGWTAGALVSGAMITVAFWAAMQTVLAFVSALQGEISLHPQWKSPAITAAIGRVLGQLLGNAFVEETVFRGFLLPQFYLRLVHGDSHPGCDGVRGANLFRGKWL